MIDTLKRSDHLLHTDMDMPPAIKKAPENAHVKLEYMSCGVISS